MKRLRIELLIRLHLNTENLEDRTNQNEVKLKNLKLV